MAALSAFRHVHMYRRPAEIQLTEHQNREERQF